MNRSSNELSPQMEMCVLASGSGGNCTVVRTPGGVMLIDAGIGPRTAGRRLDGTGVSLLDISSICLTHLDSDHFRSSWVPRIIKQHIRVFCHAGRVADLCRIAQRTIGGPGAEALLENFESLIETFEETFSALPDVKASTVALSHDEEGSHGFVLDGHGVRIGYATDLGHVPATLIDAFDGLDVVALESNYDPHLQRTSGRPIYLQRRITGGRGHLSNEQAFDAIRTVFDRCQHRRRPMPSHVVLLHRSRDCNCPRLVRQLYARDQRIAERLTLAEQFQRSNWIGPMDRVPIIGEQLHFWG
jgi:phosphoribosyl 1,2-cyclic phosphodiesterase